MKSYSQRAMPNMVATVDTKFVLGHSGDKAGIKFVCSVDPWKKPVFGKCIDDPRQ